MGVLNDYFRAPDDEAAAAVGERIGGPLVAGEGGEAALDGTATKGIDVPVVLGQLVAMCRDEAWHLDIMASRPVFPTGPEPDPETFDALPEDSPWLNGPWIERLGDGARDDLAAIDPARHEDLAARWAMIEELGGLADQETLVELIADLAGLAQRAKAQGDHLYCWTSL